MVIFYKKWKKYNEIQLAKNKMDLNNRKMTNHPPSPINETEEESKKRRMNVERSTAEAKKRSPVQSLCRVQSRPSLTTVRPEVL